MAKDNKSEVDMKSAIESILSQGVDKIEEKITELYKETNAGIDYVNNRYEKIVDTYTKENAELLKQKEAYEIELNDVYSETSNPEKVKESVDEMLVLMSESEKMAETIDIIQEKMSELDPLSIEYEKLKQELLIVEGKKEEFDTKIEQHEENIISEGLATEEQLHEIIGICRKLSEVNAQYKENENIIEGATKAREDYIVAVSENPIVINILRYMARLLKANITFVGGPETVIGTVDETDNEIARPAQHE